MVSREKGEPKGNQELQERLVQSVQKVLLEGLDQMGQQDQLVNVGQEGRLDLEVTLVQMAGQAIKVKWIKAKNCSRLKPIFYMLYNLTLHEIHIAK